MAQAVTSKDFEQVVLKDEGLVIVDFWAEWCPPCRALGPIIEKLGEDHKDTTNVTKLDIDSNQDVAQKYGVMSIPTVKFFKNGEEVESLVGVQPKGVYEALIKKHSK